MDGVFNGVLREVKAEPIHAPAQARSLGGEAGAAAEGTSAWRPRRRALAWWWHAADGGDS